MHDAKWAVHKTTKSVLFTVVVVKRQCVSVNIKMCNTTNIKITDVVAWLFNGVIYKNLVYPIQNIKISGAWHKT